MSITFACSNIIGIAFSNPIISNIGSNPWKHFTKLWIAFTFRRIIFNMVLPINSLLIVFIVTFLLSSIIKITAKVPIIAVKTFFWGSDSSIIALSDILIDFPSIQDADTYLCKNIIPAKQNIAKETPLKRSTFQFQREVPAISLAVPTVYGLVTEAATPTQEPITGYKVQQTRARYPAPVCSQRESTLLHRRSDSIFQLLPL